MAYQLSPEDLSFLEIIKVLEEVDKASCYDMASLDKMSSMIGLTDAKNQADLRPSIRCNSSS